MTEQDVDRLKAVTDSLTQVSHRLAQSLYEKAGASAGADAAGAAGPETEGEAKEGKEGKEGEVIDAEYVDVDDKKPN
jgi:molecular chaperone DnaK